MATSKGILNTEVSVARQSRNQELRNLPKGAKHVLS